MNLKSDLIILSLLALASFWFGGFVYQNHWARPEERPPTVSDAPARISARTLAGEDRALNTENLKRPTLLLVLSAECRYCDKNARQWRELIASLGRADSPPGLLALSLSDAEETAGYLEDNNLEVPVLLVDREQLAALGLPGVPGTIVIDPGSDTMRSWIGVLSEAEVSTILTWATGN
jgi:hypothetical protein